MNEHLPISAEKIDARTLLDYAPLTLSLVGDAVHTLFLRSYFSKKHPYDNAEIHKAVSAYARASSQAEDAKAMLPLLSDAEKRIFNKAKNAHLNTIPKSASLYEYQLSTAFEAVCGYLFLVGDNDRMASLFGQIYEVKLS